MPLIWLVFAFRFIWTLCSPRCMLQAKWILMWIGECVHDSQTVIPPSAYQNVSYSCSFFPPDHPFDPEHSDRRIRHGSILLLIPRTRRESWIPWSLMSGGYWHFRWSITRELFLDLLRSSRSYQVMILVQLHSKMIKVKLSR